MQPHSPEVINWIAKKADELGVRSYSLGAFTAKYAVMHLRDDQKPFDYTVMAGFSSPKLLTHQPGDEQRGSIIVSDDVPKELQGLWAMHEYLDFQVLGHSAQNRCLKSDFILSDILTKTNNIHLLYKYSKLRIGFYENLGKYMLNSLRHEIYDNDDIAGCYRAVSYHSTIVNKYFEPMIADTGE